jgi:hypothetical protein
MYYLTSSFDVFITQIIISILELLGIMFAANEYIIIVLV